MNRNNILKIMLVLFAIIISISISIIINKLSNIISTDYKYPFLGNVELFPDNKTIYSKSDNPFLIYKLKEFEAIEINKDLYRGEPVSINKRGIKERIIVLGDSVTFPERMVVRDSYSFKLQELLNNNSDEQYEVLNFGVLGYDIIQEYERLVDIGLKYQPDKVIIGFVLNDIGIYDLEENIFFYGTPAINFFTTKELKRRDRLIEREIGSNYKCRLKNYLKYNTLYRYTTNQLRDKYPHEYAVGDINTKIYKDDCYWNRIETYFKKFSELGEQENFDIIFMLIPILNDDEEFNKELEPIYKKIILEAEKNNFEIVDIITPFKEFGLNNLLHPPEYDNIHPGFEGHTMMAQELYKKISNEEKQ